MFRFPLSVFPEGVTDPINSLIQMTQGKEVFYTC